MTRTSKAIGAFAGAAAIAVSVPLAVTAYAQPAEPTTEPTTEAAVEVPDPQGSDCGAFKEAVPTWKNLATLPLGQALQSIPEAATFYSAISGGLNPAVNVLPVLENGPYVVFAPTNEAFAALPPAQLDALKADPAALTDLVYYHVFLGILGPNDVKGQRPTQQGADLKVTGEGDGITVNDTAKVVCGGIQAANARIYLIDAVLDPNTPPEPVSPSTTSATETTETPTTTTTTTTTPPTPMPAEVAPNG